MSDNIDPTGGFKMKIAIVGYGKMGHIVENIARKQGMEIAAIVDPVAEGATAKELSEEAVRDADVCIDFSHPDGILANIDKYCELKKNAVIATTGWYDKLDAVRKKAEEAGIGMIWSGNFSIGVNMFFRIVKAAARIVNKVEDYDILSYELHHNRKADSPSGTARMIGDILIGNIDRKTSIVYDKLDRKIKADELHVASVRGGDIPGVHVVDFDSTADTIELRHSARTRDGFASGALLAAKWLKDKKGFFDINNMMDEYFGGAENV